MDRTHLALFDVSSNSVLNVTESWLRKKREALLRDIHMRVSNGLPRKYGDALVSCIDDAYNELALAVRMSSAKRWLTSDLFADDSDAPFADDSDAPFADDSAAPFAAVPNRASRAYARVSVQTQHNGEIVRVSRETRRNEGGHNTTHIEGTRETAEGRVVRLTPAEAERYLSAKNNNHNNRQNRLRLNH